MTEKTPHQVIEAALDTLCDDAGGGHGWVGVHVVEALHSAGFVVDRADRVDFLAAAEAEHDSCKTTCDQLRDHIDSLMAENRRLREALRKAEDTFDEIATMGSHDLEQAWDKAAYGGAVVAVALRPALATEDGR